MSVLLTHAVITLEQAKRHLGLKTDDDDSISADEIMTIEELINGATELLEDALGRKIKSQTITDEVHTLSMQLKVDQNGRTYYTYPYYLQLRNFPMITVTGIKYDDTSITSITEGSTSGFYYAAQDLKDEGKVYNSSGWPCSPRTVKISYTAGWATVPYRIQNIAKEIVLFNYHKTQFGNARNILINASSDGVKSNSGTPVYRSLDEIYSHINFELSDLIDLNV